MIPLRILESQWGENLAYEGSFSKGPALFVPSMKPWALSSICLLMGRGKEVTMGSLPPPTGGRFGMVCSLSIPGTP